MFRFQSNQYRNLAPVSSRFCNGLCMINQRKFTSVQALGYVSNTSGQLFSLPVIFVLEEVGEDQMLLFKYLFRVMH